MKKLLATLALVAVLAGAACSAEGNVDTGGDGIKIEGDIDEK